MARILIVDDEPALRFSLGEVLRERGHEVKTADSAEQALAEVETVDLVLTDLAMPGKSGLELLRIVRERHPLIPVLLLTARGSERTAVEAMKAGAYDYLTKPFDIDELGLSIDRGLEARRLRTSARLSRAERELGGSMICEAPAMRQMLELVERVADKDLPVLVQGETGTGKELVGALIHALSPRAAQPLVRFNCAAIPESLAEAELFGHTRGAFSGALTSRRGFFAMADRGTLVLDEIGELPGGVQPKLLRALQSGEIQPVGAGRSEQIDVRVVACTNRDLGEEVKNGRFRADLFYRLCVVRIDVPALRDRRADIPLLAEEFVRRYVNRFGLDDVRLSPALVSELGRRAWPGNVRELENTIARLVALSRGGVIDVDALERPEPDGARGEAAELSGEPLRQRVARFERELIAEALARSGGNQSAAARELGVSRVTLIDKLKRHGLL